MILDLRNIPADGLAIERSMELSEPKGDDGRALVIGRARLSGRACPGVRGLELSARLERLIRPSR